MSKRCTVLIWNKKQLPLLSSEASASQYQPGDVVDVQPGDFDFGSEIKKLGWWKVISCTGPIGPVLKLLEGDDISFSSAHLLRRIRKKRIDLSKVSDKMKVKDLVAAAYDVDKQVLKTTR